MPRNAIQLISPRKTPLCRLAEVAKQTAEMYIEDAIPFDTAVRRTVMRVILVGMLSDFVDESTISAGDIDLVTRGINELWTLSKSSVYRPDLLTAINSCLRRWLPTYANPLEIIIPTYETMWRVVAIAVALAHDNRHALSVFTRLLQQPTHEQYREVNDGDRFGRPLSLVSPSRLTAVVVDTVQITSCKRFCASIHPLAVSRGSCRSPTSLSSVYSFHSSSPGIS